MSDDLQRIYSKLNDIAQTQAAQNKMLETHGESLKHISMTQIDQGKKLAVVSSQVDDMRPAIKDLENTKQRGIAVFTTICIIAGTVGATIKEKAAALLNHIF